MWSSTRGGPMDGSAVSAGRRAQPAAVDWGRGTDNLLLTEIAHRVLAAAGRPLAATGT
jgi:hypothetical protein